MPVVSESQAPPEVVALVANLMPRLLESEHPTAGLLRAQYGRSRITEIDLTGSGFLAYFAVPRDIAPVEPRSFPFGDATIKLRPAGTLAGCVVLVRDGRLSALDVHSHAGDWPDSFESADIRDALPFVAPANNTAHIEPADGADAP